MLSSFLTSLRFNEDLEEGGPVHIPVIVTDNYAGFIKYIIKVRNGCTVAKYYKKCLQFILGEISRSQLPRTLLARCQNHSTHGMCDYYKNASNCKTFIKCIWNVLRTTTDHSHWLEVISFFYHVSKNKTIRLESHIQ